MPSPRTDGSPGASLWPKAKIAVHDGEVARKIDFISLFDEKRPR